MIKKWSNFTNSYYYEFEVEKIKINYFETKSPSLFACVNILAGSKEYKVNDNKSGIAHFVEHVLFNNKHATNINDLMNEGVSINGVTSFNGTMYYIGSNKEEMIEENLISKLFDISLSLNIDEEIVINERGIISSEAKESETSPISRFYQDTGKMFFKNTGLEKEVIGEVDDINSTTLDDVISFYQNFYTTDNIVINLVGDLSNSDIDKIAQIIKDYKLKTKNHLSNVFDNKLLLNKEKFTNIDYVGELEIKTNKINYNLDEYLIMNNPNINIDIFEYKLYVNLMFNLLNDDFNIEYYNYIKNNDILANDIDITTMSYTPDHEILLIEIKNNYNLSTKNIYNDVVKILKNSMTEELFSLMKSSKYLDSLEKKDQSVNRKSDDIFSHVLINLIDNDRNFQSDYSYNDLSFDKYNEVVDSIDFDKYLLVKTIMTHND